MDLLQTKKLKAYIEMTKRDMMSSVMVLITILTMLLVRYCHGHAPEFIYLNLLIISFITFVCFQTVTTIFVKKDETKWLRSSLKRYIVNTLIAIGLFLWSFVITFMVVIWITNLFN